MDRRKFMGALATGSVLAGASMITVDSQAAGINTGTWAQKKNSSIAQDVLQIQTSGRVSPNDGGGALYVRWLTGMPALAPEQEDVSWFASVDGAQWVLGRNQQHVDRMFGAMGDPSIDVTATINLALAAPMVEELWITAVHGCAGDIVVPSGKSILGLNRDSCGFARIEAGNTGQVGFGILLEDAVGNRLSDFFVDVRGVGAGGGLPARCSGVVVRGSGSDIFIDRVDVYNATGYAHYESASTYGAIRGIYRRNCRAYNSQVCFESTGNVVVELIDCEAYAGPDSLRDGASLIECETLFHAYGAVRSVRRVRCLGRGIAGAGDLTVTADGANVGTIVMEDCDIRLDTGSVPAIVVSGTNGFVVEDYQIIGGVFDTLGQCCVIAANASVAIRSATISGSIGVMASTGAVVDIYESEVTGIVPNAAVASYGVKVEGTGLARWHGGGHISASGGPGSAAYSGNIQFFGTPLVTPPVASAGSSLPKYRQRVRGTVLRQNWYSYQPTTSNRNYWINITLPTGVVDINRADVKLALRQPAGTLAWPPIGLAMAHNWQSNRVVQVQISTADAMSGYALTYEITEWV